MILRIFLLLLVFFASLPLAAQTGKDGGKGATTDTVMTPVQPSDKAMERQRRARERTSVLSGRVRDGETGQPLRGAFVIVREYAGMGVSGEDGTYEAAYVDSGTRTVVAHARGFESDSTTLAFVPGDSLRWDVTLRRAPPPCCTLEGTWRVHFVMRQPNGMGPAPRDTVVEGVLTFADSIPDPLQGRYGRRVNVREEFGLSDVDFTPFFGGRIARDVSTTVEGPTGGNFAREMTGDVFEGDQVEIVLIPRISHGGVSMLGRIEGDVVRGEWVQRSYAGGAEGTFEMRRVPD